MNTTTLFESKKNELGISSPGYDTTTSKEKVWHNKETGEVSLTIPAGSAVHIDFSATNPKIIYTTYEGQTAPSLLKRAYDWLDGFTMPPDIEELEEWEEAGLCETPLGEGTEADGYGPSGEPSWMLVLGYI